MSLDPSSEVWVHGLFPLPKADLSEASLLKLLENKPASILATPDLSVSLEQWQVSLLLLYAVPVG